MRNDSDYITTPMTYHTLKFQCFRDRYVHIIVYFRNLTSITAVIVYNEVLQPAANSEVLYKHRRTLCL